MAKGLMILFILGGTVALITSLLLSQKSDFVETALPEKMLKGSLDSEVFEYSRNGKELPNGEPKKCDQRPIRAALADIETEFENMDAIESLNSNSASPSERAELGKMLQDLDQLRAQDLEQQLRGLEKDVKELAAALPTRLKRYGVKQP